MSKQRPVKTERVSINPVTGKREVVVLDKPQLAMERVHEVLDGHMLSMTPLECIRTIEKVQQLLDGMRVHRN